MHITSYKFTVCSIFHPLKALQMKLKGVLQWCYKVFTLFWYACMCGFKAI